MAHFTPTCTSVKCLIDGAGIFVLAATFPVTCAGKEGFVTMRGEVPENIYGRARVDRVALRLNQRQRKTLGFERPASKLRVSVESTV